MTNVPRLRNFGLAIGLGAIWVASLAVGVAGLAWHGSEPGRADEGDGLWPLGAGERPEGWAVVMAAHPGCPCTEASASELIGAVGDLGGVETVVLRFVPDPQPAGWLGPWGGSGAIESLSRAIGARVVDDVGGRMAARLGAMTSGHVVLFGPDGAPRFRGGLTPARGHTGPNTGSASLRALVRGDKAPADRSAVYGCPLFAADACAGGCTGSCGLEAKIAAHHSAEGRGEAIR